MGSNAFILDKTSKEYIWLGKDFHYNEHIDPKYGEVQNTCFSPLRRFLLEHSANFNPLNRSTGDKEPVLIFGFAQGEYDIAEYFLGYDRLGLALNAMKEEYTKLDYSREQ